MRQALDAFQQALDGDGDTITPDFQFHLLIAQATENRYFADLMSHLGSAIIPRTRINSARFAQEGRAVYLARVQREHEDIYGAILRQDAEAARPPCARTSATAASACAARNRKVSTMPRSPTAEAGLRYAWPVFISLRRDGMALPIRYSGADGSARTSIATRRAAGCAA